MATRYAVTSGLWSSASTWDGGVSVPTSADNVYSNNFAVTVDTSPTVTILSNASTTGVTAGGSFTLTNGVTLTVTTGIQQGTSSTYTVIFNLASGNSATITTPNIPYSSIQNTNGTVVHSGTGTLTINSNISVGYYVQGVNVTSSGTLNLNGNVTNSAGSTNSNALNVTGAATINILGTIFVQGGVSCAVIAPTGSTVNINGTPALSGITSSSGNANSTGVQVNGGTVNITGNVQSVCTGPIPNIYINSGTVNITGTISGCTAGTIVNFSGTLNHTGTAQATNIGPAIAYGALGQNTILTGPLYCSTDAAAGAAAAGVNPCIAARWFPKDTALATFEYRMKAQSLVSTTRPDRSMYFSAAYASLYPATNNVRSGTSYGVGNIYTGTMAVPSPSSVSYGVAVDDTTGTALFLAADILKYPVSSLTTSGSIGERLKTSATVNVVGQLISDSLSAR